MEQNNTPINTVNTTNATKKVIQQSQYAGMSADEVLAQALGQIPTSAPTTPQAPSPSQVDPTSIASQAADTLTQMGTFIEEKLPELTPAPIPTPTPLIPIQPLNRRDTSNLIKINELFAERGQRMATYNINDKAVTVRLNGDYDSLIKAIGMATALILDSGDDYIFAPNQRVIGDLVFLREVTNLNLEFLTLPEIHFSQLIESYDILTPLIHYVEAQTDPDFVAYHDWYYTELTKSIDAALQYQNSAKGIVDALARHNIRTQQTMTEQLGELNNDKLSQVIDFIQKVEPNKK